MFNLFAPAQKTFFQFGEGETEISLAEAFAGAAGTVTLGVKGVALWTPGARIKNPKQEIVYDLRYEPLTNSSLEKFQEAAAGRYLPGNVVLFQGNNPQKISQALEMFDYVMVPNTCGIRNMPADFQNRIISYTSPRVRHSLLAPKVLDL